MKILPGRAEFFQGKGTNSTTLGPILCENVRLPKMLVKFDKSLSFPCGLSQKMISCFSNLRLNHSAGYPTFFLRTIQPCVACIWRMVSCLNIRSDMCQLMVVIICVGSLPNMPSFMPLLWTLINTTMHVPLCVIACGFERREFRRLAIYIRRYTQAMRTMDQRVTRLTIGS